MPRLQSPLPSDHGLTPAIAVFVDGWAVIRSYTHPFAGHRVGPLWVLRDAPRENPADYRREEWLACDLDPTQVHRRVEKHHRGRFAICALLSAGGDEAALRTGYKALGYRLGFTETFMVHDLARIPQRTSPASLVRVTTLAQIEQLNRAAGRRQILPAHLGEDAPVRAYLAKRDGAVVGWVSSVRTRHGHWCNSMYVSPRHRRQGIASALLTKMLRDDRRLGAVRNVLLASHTGAKLYETVGYRGLGTLFLFTPRRT